MLDDSLRDCPLIQYPYTITTVIALRRRYDSFLELSETPPEEWWDYPHLIKRHIEKLYPSMSKANSVVTDTSVYIDVDSIE